MEESIYRVRLLCDYEQWWRYNIFMTVVEYDGGNRQTGYRNFIDRAYDVDDGSDDRTAPEGYTNDRGAEITTGPCHRIEIYLYVIANTFPSSVVIRDSPPFQARLVVERDGQPAVDRLWDVNQWGGLTLVGFPVGGPDLPGV